MIEYPNTDWKLLADATLHGDTAGTEAWGKFYEQYRVPVLATIKASNWPRDSSEDLLHSFMQYLMEHSTLRRARAERGRFRAFLKTALRHFLCNEWERLTTQKAGGKVTIQTLDEGASDLPEPLPDVAQCAEWDREWATEIFAEVLRRTREVWEEKGKTERFTVLQTFLPGAAVRISEQEAARRLDMTVGAVITEISRLRALYRKCLRAVVAPTVSSQLDVEDELRFLRLTLTRSLREENS